MVDRRRRVVWTGAARAAVEKAASYIVADSPTAGRAFVERIVSAAESLQSLAHRGRLVPGYGDPASGGPSRRFVGGGVGRRPM
jgi:plasmid stabilization system protein ParE